MNYATEGHIYAKYILHTRPDAKLAVLYQNDDLGRDYLTGLKEGLGDHINMIVAEASYETTDPTIDSQVILLKESGADTFLDFSLAKFTSLTIRRVNELGWRPQHFIPSVSNGIGAVLAPAGIERSVGIYSSHVLKTASDPQWADDPGFKEWLGFMGKYLPGADINDAYYVAGYNTAQLTTQVLKQSDDHLTRENLMRQATNLKNFQPSMVLPGITVTTNPTDYNTFHSARLGRFDGKSWVLFGDLVEN
jgi:branched-chain amino acid transport system substrate-binding protein